MKNWGDQPDVYLMPKKESWSMLGIGHMISSVAVNPFAQENSNGTFKIHVNPLYNKIPTS